MKKKVIYLRDLSILFDLGGVTHLVVMLLMRLAQDNPLGLQTRLKIDADFYKSVIVLGSTVNNSRSVVNVIRTLVDKGLLLKESHRMYYFLSTEYFSCVVGSEEIYFKTYLMVDDHTGLYKIGKAVKPAIREKTLQVQVPKLRLLAVCNSDVEASLHAMYATKRVRGEWFRLSQKDVRCIIENIENFNKLKAI